MPFSNFNYCSAKQICVNSGGHLITNDEWMTIAVNVINNPENWANRILGSTISSGGGIFRGSVNLNDSVSCGNNTYLTGTEPGLNCLVDNAHHTNRNKRMLILDNGEEIWDLSGNYSHFIQNDLVTQSLNRPKRFRANGHQYVTWWTEVWQNFYFDYYRGGLVANGFYLDRNDFGNFDLNVDQFFISQNYNSKQGVGAPQFTSYPIASNSGTGCVLRGGTRFAGVGGGVLAYSSTNPPNHGHSVVRCVINP